MFICYDLTIVSWLYVWHCTYFFMYYSCILFLLYCCLLLICLLLTRDLINAAYLLIKLTIRKTQQNQCKVSITALGLHGGAENAGLKNAGLDFGGPNSRAGKCKTGKCRTGKSVSLACSIYSRHLSRLKSPAYCKLNSLLKMYKCWKNFVCFVHRKPPSLFPMVRSIIPYDLPFSHKNFRFQSRIEWCYFQFCQTQDSGCHRRLLPAPSVLIKI